MRYIYFFVAFVWVTSCALSTGFSQEYRFKRITSEEGLLDSKIHQIYEDNLGLIWIGSSRGLQLYNGHDFINFVYDPTDSLSIPFGSVNSITQDTQGRLWIGTRNGGLAKFTNNGFEKYKYRSGQENGLSSNVVNALLADKKKGIWIGTRGGLDYYNNGNFFHYEPSNKDSSNLYNGQIMSLAQTPDGTIWIGCWDGGLHQLIDGKIVPVDQLNNDERFRNKRARALFTDSKGRLWVGAWDDGLFLLEDNKLKFFEVPFRGSSDGHITDIVEDKDGGIWVGTYGGGIRRIYGEETSSITNIYGDNMSLRSDLVERMLVDRYGELWIGHSNGGISKWINSGFKSIKYNPQNDNSLWKEGVNAILGNNEGDIWFGNMTGTSTKWSDGKFERVVITPKSTYGAEESRFLNFGDNSIITGQSFWRYFLNNKNWHRLLNGLDHKVGLIFQIHEDRSGNSWLCTSQKGLVAVRKNGEVQFFNDSQIDRLNIKTSNIHGMIFDHQGRIWTSSHDMGVSVIANDEVVATYTTDESDSLSLDNPRILGQLCDSKGNIWITTWGGALNKFDERSKAFIKYFNPDDPSDIVSISEDQQGFIWLGTAQGLSKFDPDKGEFMKFGKNYGVDAYPFLPNAVYLDTVSGNLFFGGEKGVTTFNPKKLKLDNRLPEVMMTKVMVLNEKTDSLSTWFEGFVNKKMVLGYRQNSFSFEFAALNMEASYAYYLEGYENDWNFVNDRRYASYVNVPSGDYIFKIKAANSLGVWSEISDLMTIRIVPPFWQTIWFKSLLAFLFCILVFAIYEYRVRGIKQINEFQQAEIRERIKVQKQLETKNAELERFNYTVSHDLKSPLITIKGYLGLMEEDLDSDDKKSLTASIKTVKNAADKMRELLDDLLNYSKLGILQNENNLVDFNELVREVVQLHQKELCESPIKLVIEGKVPRLVGDKTRLAEVAENLIHNAIKFSRYVDHPKIEIGVQEENDLFVTLYIKDNGIGIPEEYTEKVFNIFERLNNDIEGTGIGLAIVKRVIDLHGGKIWAESGGVGKGTTFLFELPKSA